MKKIRCYLAGGFVPIEGYSDWRDFVRQRLEDKMEFYDPRIDTTQGSIATFVYQDLAGVESCEVIFYYVTNLGDIGASIECERANSKGKLVVLCVKEGITIVHPFLIGIARRIIIGTETGITYLSNLAELGIENEFQAIYKTMGKN